MNTVAERLIESWLDSQTERRYQPAFIQLLISEGWTVLHNTRHSPIELGKDVIARDPKGHLYCFQLKGNPGTHFTKREAQKNLDQFIELLDLPVPEVYRATKNERHTAVFVTNGEVNEEAQLVLSGAGERVRRRSCPAKAYEVWSRGTLVSRFQKMAGRVWPTTLDGTRSVLDFLASDGAEIPKPCDVSRVLAAVVSEPSSRTSASEKNASLTSLLLISEILKSPWYATQNHYALFSVSVLCCVWALKFADTRKRREVVKQYAEICLIHCSDLLDEADRRGYEADRVWAEFDPMSEIDFMRERNRLVSDCAATLILAAQDQPEFDVVYAKRLIEVAFRKPKLWGYGAVPSLILKYWALSRFSADVAVDKRFETQLRTIVAASLGNAVGTTPLASPYYDHIDCWASSKNLLFVGNDSIFRDSFERRVWFGRSMLFMLVKRNMKQSCKAIWPEFSQALHEDPLLPEMASFGAKYDVDGQVRTYLYHYMEWEDLVAEATDVSEARFLEQFEEFAWLLAAYITIVPYRAWTGVVMWLDGKLNDTWYS